MRCYTIRITAKSDPLVYFRVITLCLSPCLSFWQQFACLNPMCYLLKEKYRKLSPKARKLKVKNVLISFKSFQWGSSDWVSEREALIVKLLWKWSCLSFLRILQLGITMALWDHFSILMLETCTGGWIPA